MVDRVFTIALLVLGAFSVLSISSSLFALASQIRLTGTMIGIDELTLAPWVGSLGTASGIVVLGLFAIALIASIRRMRASKIAFWVPLAAGAVAIAIVMIASMIALMAGAPEIMQQLEADPNGSIDKMMEYIQQMQ